MKIFKQKGLSLTELLVSCVMVGIVMVGVTSFVFTIKRMQETTSRKSIMTVQAAQALRRMSESALLATGSVSQPGIELSIDTLSVETPKPMKWISFRHDRNKTPNNINDDTWVIYSFDIIADNTLAVCENLHINGPNPHDPEEAHIAAAECSSASSEILLDNAASVAAELASTGTTTTKNVWLYIHNVWNVALYKNITTPNPLDFPACKLEINVTPPAHTWN